MSTIVIMPGGFHPFHAGHAALYQSAVKAFPGAEVFVAATNDTSTRPFPFAIKEKLAKLAGVAPRHFVQVKSPFRAEEITAQFDPARDRLIFVRSEKDAGKPPQAGGNKKDGNPAYLQPLAGQQNIRPFAEHAYMAYLPTVEFGPGMTSATEIRTAWPTLNEKRKAALVMSLYPKTQSNPKLAATVVKLLDTAMGGEQGMAEGLEQDYLSQIPNLSWKPVSRSVWNTIQDEGLDEEQDTPSHSDWVMASLSIDAKDAQALMAFENDAIEDFNRFDIHLKSRYPGLTDLIDYDRGTVTIVKPINKQGVAEAQTDYQKRRQRERDVDAGKPVKPEPKNPQNDYFARRKKEKEQGVAEMDGQNFVGGMTASYQQRENQPIDEDYIDEKWSKKYKGSINCASPKGFSQRAHCAGRKK